jgi:hypothetical protein
MSQKNKDCYPPFTEVENLLQLLADRCFIAWSFLSVLPFLGWIWIPSRLAIDWNEAGKAIDWLDKPMALLQVFGYILCMGFWHLFLRVSAAHPSMLRYLGSITPASREKTYRLGREGLHVVLIETWILLIIKSLLDFQLYFSGSMSMLKSSDFLPLLIIIGITAIIYTVRQIDRIV